MKTASFDKRRNRKMAFLPAAAAVILLALQGAAAGAPNTDPRKEMQDTWGIQVVSLRTSAAGNMIDFRYRVLDAGKAGSLFVREIKPYLIHQKTGKVLAVPVTAKVGPLRSTNKPRQDRIYWMFFGNKTKLVQPGDKVTVAMGKFRVEDLIVE